MIDVYVSQRRDIGFARRFFTAAVAVHGDPAEVVTDRAPALVNVIEELVPAALHNTGQNNRVECDRGRLKARLRPMRGLKTHRTGSVVIRGHAFIQDLRHGHYELAVDATRTFRSATAIRRTQTRRLISTGPQVPASAWPAIEQRNRAPDQLHCPQGHAAFRTAEGSKLLGVVMNEDVAVEIDGERPHRTERDRAGDREAPPVTSLRALGPTAGRSRSRSTRLEVDKQPRPNGSGSHRDHRFGEAGYAAADDRADGRLRACPRVCSPLVRRHRPGLG